LTFAARNPKKIKTADEVEDEVVDEEASAVTEVDEVADEAEEDSVTLEVEDEEVSVVTEVDEVEAEEHQVSLPKPTEDPSKSFKEPRKHLTIPIKLMNYFFVKN
jgi:hypothetical protein